MRRWKSIKIPVLLRRIYGRMGPKGRPCARDISIADLSLSEVVGGYGRWEVYTIESRDLFFLLAISRAPWGCHCEAVAMATQNSDVRAPRNVKQSTGERERERKKDHRLSLSLRRSVLSCTTYALSIPDETSTARLS